MSCQVSIIIPTFQRGPLLRWNLYSLAKQEIPLEFETLIVNDGIHDDTESLCLGYREKLNIRYIFAGLRNLSGQIQWRVPGFAINIGAQFSYGRVLIICCAEMYHLNNTIARLTYPLLDNQNLLGIPIGKDDNGSFLWQLEQNDSVDHELFQRLPYINTELPYLMSISREQFFTIGGYDEDFTGAASEDEDLVERLYLNGCRYIRTEAETAHLYHPRQITANNPAVLVNRELYIARRGQIVRNQNRDWGRL